MKIYTIHLKEEMHEIMADGHIIDNESITFYLNQLPVFIAFKKSIDYISIKY